MSVRSTRVAMYAGPVLIAALVGLVYARGLQEDARQLAETGREHQRLLARLNRGLGQLDAGLIAALEP